MSQPVPQEVVFFVGIIGVLAAFVLVVDTLLLILALRVQDEVRAGQRLPLFADKWSLADPWWGGQLVVVLILLGVGLSAQLHRLLTPAAASTSGDVLLAVVTVYLQNAVLAGVAIAYVVRKYGSTLREIGLAWPPKRPEVALGIVGGVVMMVTGLAAEHAVKWLGQEWLSPPTWERLERLNSVLDPTRLLQRAAESPLSLWLLVLGIAVAAPVGEELFFRGFLHTCARRRLGAFWGTLLSSGTFALVHGGPLMVPAILPLGILLAIAYDRTTSLWVPIVMHTVNNGVLAMVIVLAPQGGRL